MTADVQHFVTIFASSIEGIDRATRAISDTSKAVWNGFDNPAARSVGVNRSSNPDARGEVYEKTLTFGRSGEESSGNAASSAAAIAAELRATGMRVTTCPDSSRARGWQRNYASKMVLG